MASVSTVMTSNPACCTAQTPLRDVARMMIDNDCGQIPVVDDAHRPIGVVTDRDIAVRAWSPSRTKDSSTGAPKVETPFTW